MEELAPFVRSLVLFGRLIESKMITETVERQVVGQLARLGSTFSQDVHGEGIEKQELLQHTCPPPALLSTTQLVLATN